MISSDLPIYKSSEDIFNRSPFAESLAQTIVKYSDSSSFTIGLYGPWGSGKTSLLNMIVESVEAADSNTIILRFNPWLCSEPKQLVTQFFKQLSSVIKLRKTASDLVWKLIDQYGDFFAVASNVSVIGSLIAAGGKALSKEAEEQIERRSDNLQLQKDRIIKRMEEEQLRILVLIDDIDRLSEEEIISVFQLVKALADFPNMIYVLAFDYSVVVSALSKVQHGNGKEYLEKIVQVPFEIPAPDMETIYDFLLSKLNSIMNDITEELFDQSLWAELFQYGFKKYIRSVRDVIRYANVLTIKYQLLKDEVNPVDLLGITCLQVFEPFIYSKLPGCKETICGYPTYYTQDSQKQEEKVRNMLSRLAEPSEQTSDTDGAKNVLGLLFPKIRNSTGIPHSIGQAYNRKNTLIRHRISATECFDRYFALSLEKDAISHGEIYDFLFNMDEDALREELVRVYQQGKIIRMLDETEAYAANEASISESRAATIMKALSQTWNQFETPERGFFDMPFTWRFLFCADPLLKAIGPSSRFQFVYSLFEDPCVHPSTLSLLLQNFENQHGRFNGKESEGTKENPLLYLDEVLKLEEVFKRRAIQQLDLDDAIQQNNGLNFLWMLEQLDSELTAEKKKQLVSDDSSLIKIIGYCTSHGQMLSSVVSKTRRVNLKSLGEFIENEEAYRRIKAFMKSKEFAKLPSEDWLNVGAFIMEYETNESELSFEENQSDEAIRKYLHQQETSN